MIKTFSIKLFLFACLLNACTNSKLAPVEYKGEYFYGFQMEDQGNFRLTHPQSIVVPENYSYEKIARIYDIPLNELLLANNENTQRKLAPGEKVFFPQFVYHTVVHGEDLELISDFYQISQNKIKKTNNLNSTNIRLGQVLKIPVRKATATEYDLATKLPSTTKQNYISPPNAEIHEVIVYDLTSTDSQSFAGFIWPVKGKILKHFNISNTSPRSEGINIEAKLNTPILAIEEGKIVYAGSELKGYGKMMIIKHPDGWLSAYAHQSQFNVSKGALVKKGDTIGFVGNSGAVNSSQLYFAIRKGSEPHDPLELLPK